MIPKNIKILFSFNKENKLNDMKYTLSLERSDFFKIVESSSRKVLF